MVNTYGPATWEAKTGELLEPRRQRLQWAKIVPLHSSLGNRARLCLKKKNKSRDESQNLTFYLGRKICNLGHICRQGNLQYVWITKRRLEILFKKRNVLLFENFWPSAVAHTSNSSTLGGWGGRMAWAQEFKTGLGKTVRPHRYEKI